MLWIALPQILRLRGHLMVMTWLLFLIPFCAYNSGGHREEGRDQLASEQKLDNARKKIAFVEKTNGLTLQPADD